jgi:class 3 adenylate cyclase
MTATRRLAAILAADLAGYSRLMGADEEGTHERLKAHRRELVDPKIGEHSSRIPGLLTRGPDDRRQEAGGIRQRRITSISVRRPSIGSSWP